MRTSIKSASDREAAELLAQLDRQGFSGKALIEQLSIRLPAPGVAAPLFRLLIDRFAAAGDVAGERWAARKALEMDARQALEARTPAPAPTGLPSGSDAYGIFRQAMEQADTQAGEAALADMGRDALRSHLRRWFTGAAVGTAYNLIYVDADAAGGEKSRAEVLSALLDSRPREVPEAFLEAETAILWIGGREALFITGSSSHIHVTGRALKAAGRSAAHYAFPEKGSPAGNTDWEPASGKHRGEDYAAASVRNRECLAVEQLPLFARLMQAVTGNAAFTEENGFMGLARMFVQHAGEYRLRDANRNDTWTHLVTAHAVTNAWANDFIQFLLRLYTPPYPLPGTRGVLGDLTHADIGRVVADLDANGFHRFDQRVPMDICQGLVRHARETECSLHGETVPKGAKGRYDGRNPRAPKYLLDPDLALKTPEFQALLADHSILSVSQAYLGSRIMMETCVMWWLPVFGQVASAVAAQQFHFDMDRWKWLKWFVYLTDVTTQTAPHTVIAKSHRRNAKPAEILGRGYVRVSDEELARHYPERDFIELVGPVGTIMCVDTRAWHKGKPPMSGERLILEITMSSTLFGNDSLVRGPTFGDRPIPQLASLMSAFPRLYSYFT